MSPENDERGQYGTATLDSESITMRLWEVSETDPRLIRGFAEVKQDMQLYNVTISVESKSLNHSIRQKLSKPVQREVVGQKISVQPELVLREVKLFNTKGDPTPAAAFDELRIISGPQPSAQLVVFVCVNQSPKR